MTSPENTALAVKLVPSIEITAAMVSDLRPDLAAVAKAYAQAALDPYIVTVRPAVALALQSKDDSAALEIDRLKAENKGCEEEIEQLNAQLEDCSAELRDYDRNQASASAEIDRLKGEIGRLRTCVLWSVENDGECLGDWPKLLDRARAALHDGGKL